MGKYQAVKIMEENDIPLAFKVGVKTDLYKELKGKLHTRVIDDLELRRELAIMHKIQETRGEDINEKINNFVEDCKSASVKKAALTDYYKMKHKH